MSEKQYEKTTAGLRDMLFDTALGVRTGAIDVSQGKIIAALAHQIVGTLDVELAAQKQMVQLKLGGEDAQIIAPPKLQLIHE